MKVFKYGTVYAIDLFSTQEYKEDSTFEWWIWEESQFLIKYSLDSVNDRSVLEADKHFG